MRVITIGISGPSCSGKTTITRILQQLVKKTIVIYQDDFFKPDTDIPVDPETQLSNWDCPEALDFERLIQTIQYVQQHHVLPTDYHSNEVNNTHDGSDLVTPQQISEWKKKIHQNNNAGNVDDDTLWLIVDGFMLISDPQLYGLFDYRVFVTASYTTLKKRREDRQGYHTLEGYWVDPPGYFDAIVWPEFLRAHQHVPGPHHQQQQEKQNLDDDHDVILIDTDILSIPEAAETVISALWS
ncbi:P-loop containing nucleoside triphosphate hydrolase protein [Halteromyces radiatus]|uniref:P-loop containing nucleoside triphosphate hydrolase protein n=1 Tax=Halteromyces radiatus TaxID=101107 RepID=UPI00221FC6CE|nr:P-loop containing nucleoside triphosphate hydrolase protein [Halteromyces radiatus]KAI8078902.1 P-loop containing nucleoside triphosphate hydrolase protein [Halteromyces radiatus]